MAYGLLFGVRLAYEYATTSPRFEVRRLIYTPTHHVGDERVRQLMALAPGTNILSLDLEEIAGRIAVDPWVARASVVRALPDTLRVEVTEHEPVAVLLAGTFWLVDRQGLPFKRLARGERGQLPVITGFERTALLWDAAVTAGRIARALAVLTTYASKQRPRLAELHIDDHDTITLYTAELGSQLRLGRADAGLALARYDALRAALGEETDKLAVAHLDLAVGPRQRERVVASFYPSRGAPAFVAEAQAEAAAKAATQVNQASNDATGEHRAKPKSRLPKYE